MESSPDLVFKISTQKAYYANVKKQEFPFKGCEVTRTRRGEVRRMDEWEGGGWGTFRAIYVY
jgi:hypothetical protein